MTYLHNLTAATSALAWLIVTVATLALIAIALTNGLVGLLAWIDTSTDVDEQTAAEWDTWVETALLMSETPIYDATAAHIAAHEAAGPDVEWRQMSDGGWAS